MKKCFNDSWAAFFSTTFRKLGDQSLSLSDILDANEMNAIRDIFSRPWWTRAWVVQECVRASTVLFRCGSLEVRIEQIMGGISSLILAQLLFPCPMGF